MVVYIVSGPAEERALEQQEVEEGTMREGCGIHPHSKVYVSSAFKKSITTPSTYPAFIVEVCNIHLFVYSVDRALTRGKPRAETVEMEPWKRSYNHCAFGQEKLIVEYCQQYFIESISVGL
ncbi:hypothetical protein AJ80_06398 [Polytolypa hystricis UAMH7299]|uniref:Uncharacterized protein n=1 Tax=Polytolypa hystricis (strain UAMH7299) TaxID=1447883 RepID=A0A2B7XXS8_POLH7|nr:hypothetical protein AJ80_06398 [Polytolypa hystricis UAMH7299]